MVGGAIGNGLTLITATAVSLQPFKSVYVPIYDVVTAGDRVNVFDEPPFVQLKEPPAGFAVVVIIPGFPAQTVVFVAVAITVG